MMHPVAFLSSMAVAANAWDSNNRYIRSFKQNCVGADTGIDHQIDIGFTADAYKPEIRKQQALKVLDTFKTSLLESNNRRLFKAQDGEVVGFIWAGSRVHNGGLSENTIVDFIDEIKTHDMPHEIFYQDISEDSMSTFGIILTTRGSENAQKAVKLWSQNEKYRSQTGFKKSKLLSSCFHIYENRKVNDNKNDHEAGDCDIQRISAGSSPSKNMENLKSFNPHLEFSNVMDGQPYCYTVGSPPDFRPSPNPNGTCVIYKIQQGDTCEKVAAKYWPLKPSELDHYNQDTYSWKGCDALQEEQLICISDGKTPILKPDPHAECGLSAPKELYNKECPNKACCNGNGYCGITSEYCDVKNETVATGTSGCYSNCGCGTLPKRKASSFKRVAYWSDTFGPLYMNASDVKIYDYNYQMFQKSKDYDSVHYAFADINEDMSISVGDGFEGFLSIKSKKILSVGGWNFSTSPKTYHILRKAVSDEHRHSFAHQVVSFMQKHNLDGVDFNWQYPEAQDIPNIPPGEKGDGQRYAELLKSIKDMDRTKTVSVAIPASYRYLKGFPLAKLDATVDYFGLMSYDYSGQWDFAQPNMGIGCHNDRFVTEEAIKMIVKSGIDTTKLYGGSANYGRTFRLADPSCKKYKCPFVGPDSPIAPGEFTQTAGMLSTSEIKQLGLSKMEFNETSKCHLATYNLGSDWVAWMKESDVFYTESWYQEIGLGGSVLWSSNFYIRRLEEPLESSKCVSKDENLNCEQDPNLQPTAGDVTQQPEYTVTRKLEHVASQTPPSNIAGNSKTKSADTIISDQIFGEKQYTQMLKVRNILSYLTEALKHQPTKNQDEMLISYLHNCSTSLFEEITLNFPKYASEEKKDLKAIAYVLVSNADLMKTPGFAVAMTRIHHRNSVFPNYNGLCTNGFLREMVEFKDQLIVALAMLYTKLQINEPKDYEEITSLGRDCSCLLEKDNTLASDLMSHSDRFRNQQCQPVIDANFRAFYYVPETTLDPERLYPNSMTALQYETVAFEPFTKRWTYHKLNKVCLQSYPDDHYHCLRHSANVRYDPPHTNFLVEAANKGNTALHPTPLYVVNSDGKSPGAACNASLYLLSEQGRRHMMFNGLPYLTRGPGATSHLFSKRYATCPGLPDWQKHEFPPSSTREGVATGNWYEGYTGRVSCIKTPDQYHEARSLAMFYRGQMPHFKEGNVSVSTTEGPIHGSGMTTISSTKRRPIKEGDVFYVAVKIDQDVDCSNHSKLPKMKTRDGYEKDGYGSNTRIYLKEIDNSEDP
ncbi:hypothetical protein JCM33374_g5159 [Metschnikowia sp. JCM 33374]|nr:hypothetical protein JCM33374_g5159 [Metschnikowia sp. JCM 33374]